MNARIAIASAMTTATIAKRGAEEKRDLSVALFLWLRRKRPFAQKMGSCHRQVKKLSFRPLKAILTDPISCTTRPEALQPGVQPKN